MPDKDPAPTGTLLAEDIAVRVIKGLGQSVIPSVIPAYIGDMIRDVTKHDQLKWRHSIPLAGAMCICVDWTLNADGTVNLELQDSYGQSFWRGTFRPDHA